MSLYLLFLKKKKLIPFSYDFFDKFSIKIDSFLQIFNYSSTHLQKHILNKKNIYILIRINKNLEINSDNYRYFNVLAQQNTIQT